MDNNRPSLDLKYFEDICPDKNVPVIAVFTKYDQFKRDIGFRLEDKGHDPGTDLEDEAESIFRRHYLAGLKGTPPFVRLQRMHKHGQPCAGLIELTANALSSNVVAIMLLAVQKDNLELNIKQAITWVYPAIRWRGNTKAVIRNCLLAFPSLWFYDSREEEEPDEFELLERELSESLLRKPEQDGEFRGFKRKLEIEPPRSKELERFNTMISTLRSFVAKPPLSISSDDTCHTMIAILILEQACLLYASSSGPPYDEALDMACTQYMTSDVHNALIEQFHSSWEYSLSHITKFILEHHLS